MEGQVSEREQLEQAHDTAFLWSAETRAYVWQVVDTYGTTPESRRALYIAMKNAAESALVHRNRIVDRLRRRP